MNFCLYLWPESLLGR